METSVFLLVETREIFWLCACLWLGVVTCRLVSIAV